MKNRPYIDEEGRLHLFSLCDGTLIFLQELVTSLKQMGCSDIRYGQQVLAEGMPEGKPWMNCLFEASGQLPGRLWPGAQVLEISPGKYGLLGPDAPVRPVVRENRYQDSAMHKWLATEFFEKFGKEIRNDLLKEVSKDEGNHDPAALGDTHCLSGWERTAAQSRGDKGVEDELPGAAGDPCGEDRA